MQGFFYKSTQIIKEVTMKAIHVNPRCTIMDRMVEWVCQDGYTLKLWLVMTDEISLVQLTYSSIHDKQQAWRHFPCWLLYSDSWHLLLLEHPDSDCI